MAGEVRFQLTNNLDPLQTLDICHEIVNMTFCTSDKAFSLKKCTKKKCLDRYDSSESSDSGVATFITELGSPLTPESRVSEYSIPSPGESDPIIAPPPTLTNSTDQIDLACWPWNHEDWTKNSSNIELFSDTFDTTNYCNTDTSISNNGVIKNAVDTSSSNDKLNIFQNSSKLNDLFNSLPINQCEVLELSNIKSEFDIFPAKNCFVSNEELPNKCNNIQSNILDNTNQTETCSSISCSNNFNKQLCEINNISNKDDKLNCEVFIDTADNYKLNNSISDNESDNTPKKLCFDQAMPNMGRYFMRSSSGISNIELKSKVSQLLDQNKNVQSLTSMKSKCSLKSPINKYYQCDNNVSIRNNEQLNYSTKKIASTGFNSNKIRFPNSDSHWISLRGNIVCRWNGCNSYYITSAKLIEHIQVKHVNSQTYGETFVCLWSDCKVFNKPSCSHSWLERHILTHCGNKPLHCIVQKCRQRFSSQIMLQRHVNQHFKSTNNKDYDGLNGKLIRRKGKKLRLRRQPFTARKFDYFDKVTMIKLQTQLFLSTQNSQQDFIDYSRRSIKFQPKMIAKRILENKKQELLIRWFPPNILDDEWIIFDKKTNLEILERIVPIMALESEKRDSIIKLFGNIFPPSHRSRK